MDGNRPGGGGHPLPASDESRHGEIPEAAVEEKGFGDDAPELVQPTPQAANPDGEPYRYDDNGRAEEIDTGQRGGAQDREGGETARNEDFETGKVPGQATLGPGTPA